MRLPIVLVVAGIVVSTLVASSAATSGGAAPRIVYARVCGHATRTYSVLPDGSDLRPFPPATEQLTPLAISGDGGTIAFRAGRDDASGSGTRSGPLFLARADGTGLRPVGEVGNRPALSRDGLRLAYMKGNRLWVIGADGRTSRQVASGIVSYDLSPDGRWVVLEKTDASLVVRPLVGTRRIIVREPATRPRWSPDGRWIAFQEFVFPGRVSVIRADGSGRRVLGDELEAFAWAADSRTLALLSVSGTKQGVVLVGADGSRRRRLGIEVEAADLRWSPDGRFLALSGLGNVLVVHSTGRGTRTLTHGCWNTLVGWTLLAPP
jgi:Tol biopolymer transport system component